MESQQQQTENTFQQSSNFANDLANLNSLINSLRFTTPTKNTKTADEEAVNPKSSPSPLSARPVENAVEAIVEKPAEATATVAHPKCPYCDQPHPTEKMADHKENCEARKIQCEACEEMVMIDIFDFHLEVCPARADPYGMYQAEHEEFSPEMNQNEQEEGQNPENWNGEENYNQEGQEEEEEDDFDPDMMTYEQLMALDSTITKKGLTTEELKNLPVKVYLKTFDGNCSCSICIGECESGEMIRQLPCTHRFHKDCIDTWLESNITCPICKKYLR